MILTLPLLLPRAHVPGFGCADGCCVPPLFHTTSQAFCLRGRPGTVTGYEVHLVSPTYPVDSTDAADGFEFGAIFRDADLDNSTVALRVGCQGCALGDDLTLATRLPIDLQPGTIEPFTQHVMRAFAKGDVGDPVFRFGADALTPALCPSRHFGVTLEVFPNATGDVVWSAVLGGAGESFTPMELASFGSYILMNHGEQWNGMAWTIVVSAGAAAFAIAFLKALRFAFRADFSIAGRVQVLDTTGVVRWAFAPRELCYEVAVFFFVTTVLEVGIHWVYAATRDNVDVDGFGVGGTWGIVVAFANLFPLFITLRAWNSMYNENRRALFVNANVWAPVEVLTGFLFLFGFGSGLFFGPLALLVAGVLRLFRETSYLGRAVVLSKAEETVPTTARRLLALANGP